MTDIAEEPKISTAPIGIQMPRRWRLRKKFRIDAANFVQPA